jgi:osmoprotectant transport system substrate-binding protein
MPAGNATDLRRRIVGSPDGLLVVGGLGVLALGMLVVRNGTVSGAEEWAFRAVNDGPGWLYKVASPVQQVGALLLGPVVAVVAVVLRRYRLAAAALAATALKLLSERVVKALVSRQRPRTSIGPDIHLRGDVPATGESFVSGHAVIVAAIAGVVTPYLPGRWKVVPWVFVAAVMLGRVYVGAHNPLDVVCGAALGIAIAGAVNWATGAGRRRAADGPVTAAVATPTPHQPAAGRRPTSRVRTVVIAGGATAALVGLVACVDHRDASTPQSLLADDTITVGSFDFTESAVLAEVYSQGLEAAGYDVERAFSLGPREFVAPALVAGLVEVVPEYAASAATFHSLGTAELSDDAATTRRALERSLLGTSITVLRSAPAEDTNTFVVTRDTARRLGLETISDLAAASGSLVLGGPPECPGRRLCLAGLEDVYGARFKDFIGLDAGGPLTHDALVRGHVDVALLFTTDPSIQELDLVELVDDRALQADDHVTPLVRTEVIDHFGRDVVTTIDDVSARLTTATVRDLDRSAAAPGADVSAVVAAWWSQEVTS